MSLTIALLSPKKIYLASDSIVVTPKPGESDRYSFDAVKIYPINQFVAATAVGKYQWLRDKKPTNLPLIFNEFKERYCTEGWSIKKIAYKLSSFFNERMKVKEQVEKFELKTVKKIKAKGKKIASTAFEYGWLAVNCRNEKGEITEGIKEYFSGTRILLTGFYRSFWPFLFCKPIPEIWQISVPGNVEPVLNNRYERMRQGMTYTGIPAVVRELIEEETSPHANSKFKNPLKYKIDFKNITEESAVELLKKLIGITTLLRKASFASVNGKVLDDFSRRNVGGPVNLLSIDPKEGTKWIEKLEG
ncbi:MAG: hypothetical protein HY094_06100 [Candidatus Melainabacteria bacterium]|nr:hypothetical protein [Candidatus Melainabacteria bacterium]